MGSALAKAIRQGNPELTLNLSDRNTKRLQEVSEELSASAYALENISELIKRSQVIMIGIKPKDIVGLFEDIHTYLENETSKLWISMAVATSLNKLQNLAPDSHRWIRIMPNTPVEVNEGWLSYCKANNVTEEDEKALLQLFNKAGRVTPISEDLFDIAGAVAGSGPAFIYQLIEAMSDAGVMHGLSRQDAIMMAAQTVLGSAKMVIESGKHPGALKDAVTSPNGTTIQGVAQLEAAGYRSAMIQAINTTYRKSVDLSK